MTKLLILSDSHGGSDAIARVLKAERENIDALIFLGDGLRDLELALTKSPRLRTYAVAGNCDFGALEPYDGLAAFDQVIVFYTHGHMYGVKYDLDTLADAADLPHGTSLALQGANVDLTTDPEWLAEALTDFGFDRPMYVFARDGFAPFREEYKKACVNIGRRVTFDLPGGGEGSGEAVDIDEEGRLVVRTDSGEEHVFTGEVSVHGIYGAV